MHCSKKQTQYGRVSSPSKAENLKGKPTDPAQKKAFVLNGEGLVAFYNNQNSLAIEKFQKAIRLSPSISSFYYNLGNAFFKKRKYEESIYYYDKSIFLNPNYPGAIYQKGLALQNQGKFQQAIISYDRLIQVDPEIYGAYLNRGFSLIKLNRFEESIVTNTQAITLDPSRYHAYLNRGNTHNYLGKIAKACQDWQKACDLGSQKACYKIEGSC